MNIIVFCAFFTLIIYLLCILNMLHNKSNENIRLTRFSQVTHRSHKKKSCRILKKEEDDSIVFEVEDEKK